MKAVSVLGAGSWGIAVANLLATEGNAVTLWMHAATTPKDLAVTREDKSRLPGVKIHPAIELTDNLKQAAMRSDIIFVAVPAQHVRGLCEQLTETGKTIGILVTLAKGIEVSSLQRDRSFGTFACRGSCPRYTDLRGRGRAVTRGSNRNPASAIDTDVPGLQFR
jgi:glycerol-3-phosphate dehydrogenase